MRFILSHLKVAFEITGESKRLEIFEYPLPALRELLLNAVVHRDYTSSVDTQIKIFDNSISYFNPRKMFGDLTIEKLKRDDYQSRARNKLIVEAFYLTRDIAGGQLYDCSFRQCPGLFRFGYSTVYAADSKRWTGYRHRC